MKVTIATARGEKEIITPGCYRQGNRYSELCGQRFFCGTRRKGRGCMAAGDEEAIGGMRTEIKPRQNQGIPGLEQADRSR